jgi:CRP/FNR family transcriptional regulator
VELIDFPKIKVSCQNCSLAELCLPHGLNADELKRLDAAVRRSRPLHKGDRLFQPGDAATSLFAVRSGSIKLYATLDDGDQQVIGFYLPGELLGLDGIETGAHRCTAVALETSSACAVPFNDLKTICRQVPSLQEQMLRLFSRELSAEHELLLSITRRTAEERVATFLTSLAARFKRIGYSPNEFKLSMSREEIGSYLGLTIETVSRIFTRLREQGLIALNRRQVTIRDGARLHALGHGSGPMPTTPSRAALR